MDNHTYNLVKAVAKKAQTIWRYEQYLKDSKGCRECQALWKKLKNQDSRQLDEMRKVLVNHVKTGRV